jgi:hypothetical protein
MLRKLRAGNKQRAELDSICSLLLAGCFLGFLFDSEDGSNMFFRNVGELAPDYSPSLPRL